MSAIGLAFPSHDRDKAAGALVDARVAREGPNTESNELVALAFEDLDFGALIRRRGGRAGALFEAGGLSVALELLLCGAPLAGQADACGRSRAALLVLCPRDGRKT